MTLEEFAKAVAKHDDNLRWMDKLLFGQDMDEARDDAFTQAYDALADQDVNVGAMKGPEIVARAGDIYTDAYIGALKMTMTTYAKAAAGPKATLVKEIFENAHRIVL